ncbi:nucleotidyltransferase family protein [Streptomyces sp. AJS327]|nr:nucleotidyltransferase family protein [Streptomyces sp. AJS327]
MLLAAGAGRRLGGRPKALLERNGRTLLDHAVRALREGGCRPVHAVLGARATEVTERASEDGWLPVVNPDWASGMGGSLGAGLRSLERTGVEAALVTLVDQPGVGAEAIARVRAAFRHPGTLAAATYDGRRGHPVLLGAAHWAPVVESATGDRGARAYLAGRAARITLVECGDVADAGDVDTPEDLWRLDR